MQLATNGQLTAQFVPYTSYYMFRLTYIAIFRKYTQRSCSVRENTALKKVKFIPEQAIKAQGEVDV